MWWKNTESNVKSPGEKKDTKTKVLETGAELMQDKTPLKSISMYLDGFHFYNGNMEEQMEAHHYCTKLNEEVTQCIIYDGNGEDAKIMGVEYIISEKLFKSLPAEEKKLWHSHVYEVKSGSLIAPGLPEVAEYELMEKIVSTYGKTIHTWHTDQKTTLPIGIPQIMMVPIKEGQTDTAMLRERDQKFDIKTAEKELQRKDIPTPQIEQGADAWKNNEVRQLQLCDKAVDHH